MNQPKYVMNRPCPPEGASGGLLRLLWGFCGASVGLLWGFCEASVRGGASVFLALMMHRPLGDKSSVSGKKMGKKYEKEKKTHQ